MRPNFRTVFAVVICSVLTACMPVRGFAGGVGSTHKPIIMFSIDQGLMNGPVQNSDSVGLQNVINTLKTFQSKFEVYAVLRADETTQSQATLAMNLLTSNGVPFYLDVYSSDVMGIINGMSPYDRTHGRALSTTQLSSLKSTYPNSFMGIRIFEVFAENYSILACEHIPADASWCAKWASAMPQDPDRFYQDQFVKDYMDWAYTYYTPQNGSTPPDTEMGVLFSDFYWSAYPDEQSSFATGTVNQPQNEAELKSELSSHKYITFVAFANNQAGQATAPYINTYQTDLASFVTAGAETIALSDQSWYCSNSTTCPSSTMVQWSNTIYDNGNVLRVVETEPYWYWWQFPVGSGSTNNYTTDPTYPTRGGITCKLKSFAANYGITLTMPAGQTCP